LSKTLRKEKKDKDKDNKSDEKTATRRKSQMI
jgi:hypothetical protein